MAARQRGEKTLAGMAGVVAEHGRERRRVRVGNATPRRPRAPGAEARDRGSSSSDTRRLCRERPPSPVGRASRSGSTPAGGASRSTGFSRRPGWEPPSPFVMAFCDGGYTTNLPVEDLLDRQRWSCGSTSVSRSNPSTAARRASSCRSTISGSRPSGCGGCISWGTTSRALEAASAMLIRAGQLSQAIRIERFRGSVEIATPQRGGLSCASMREAAPARRGSCGRSTHGLVPAVRVGSQSRRGRVNARAPKAFVRSYAADRVASPMRCRRCRRPCATIRRSVDSTQ